MKEKTKKIIDLIDNTDEVKEMKKLIVKINNNEEYIKLMNNFLENEDSYIKDNLIEEKIKDLRKKLFSIDELQRYLKLQNKLRILSININNIILDVLK